MGVILGFEQQRSQIEFRNGIVQACSLLIPPFSSCLILGDADSESVRELLEEGQSFEAEAVMGVENVPDADVSEIHLKQVREDDVPQEYLDQDKER